MINHFFSRMSEVAIYSVWTFIDYNHVFGTTSARRLCRHRGNILAHGIFVMIYRRISAQPSTIDVRMREPAKFVVVIVALAAPRRAKNSSFTAGQ